MWASTSEQQAREAELVAIRDGVEHSSVNDCLAKEREHNRLAQVTLYLPESLRLAARGHVGDKRIKHNRSLAGVVGELLSSYPVEYDSDTAIPHVGEVRKLAVRANAHWLSISRTMAAVDDVPFNELLLSHLESALVALNTTHDKKAPTYPAI